MKILSIEIDNVLAITAVRLEPNGRPVVIGGANGAGKSSVLNAIAMAFGGGRAIPEEPMHRGAESAHVVCETEELTVTRKWTAAGKSTIEVRARDGSRVAKPQEVLDRLFGALTFDPLAFERMAPRDQRAALMKIAGLDFAASDAQRAAAYDARTDVNREVKRLEGAVASIPPTPAGGPTEERSIGDVLAELRRRETGNAENAARRRELGALRDRATKQAETIRRLRSELAAAEETLASMTRDGKAMAAVVEALVDAPTSEVSAQIATLEADNKRARDFQAREKLRTDLRAAQAKADAHTKTIEGIDAKKAAAAAAAKYPIPGLVVTDDGVRLNGVPFANASSAERLRASVAIGAAENPQLRVMLIRDGALLDDRSLETLAGIAAEYDIQTWTEVVGNRKACTVLIADGEVAVDTVNPTA